MISTITVYCSSSESLAQHYYDAGRALGASIAQNRWTLVYGGNSVGLMKTVADAVRENGGKVIGVTPQLFINMDCHDRNCDLIVAATMRERKRIMEEHGDALIALPGGLGTLEEIFEVIVGKSLGYHDKPIVLMNVARFYDPLLAMIEHAIEQKFIKPKARELYFVASNVQEAMRFLERGTKKVVEDFPSARE